MWKKSIFILLFLFFVVFGVASYKYLYQNHRSTPTAEVDFATVSEELYNAFVKDSNAANKKYLNKIITVSGTVTEQDETSLTMNKRILCYFPSTINKNSHKMRSVKGRCIGFDELLEVVKLDECSFVNK
jgi:hypothetical protein